MISVERSWLALAIAIGVAVVLAIVVWLVAAVVSRLIARRRRWQSSPLTPLRVPFRVLVLLVFVWAAVQAAMPRALDAELALLNTVTQGFALATIAVGAWLVVGVVTALFDHGTVRYNTASADDRHARRVRTQLAILRRVTVAIVVVLAIGAMLMTFPEVRAVGASLLASAGVASVIAGLAAQSVLSNVFAGLQLAFSDAIRVEDVVVVEGQWGRIEEITLTYVVVQIWDDRRFVLPSTYFTSTPFENWTRHGNDLLGAIEIDLDWRVDPSGLRDELDRICSETELWDGRTKVLQITDATGGYIRIRALVSAQDSGSLFDLRCLVREELVAWVGAQNSSGLPRTRVESVPEEVTPRAPRRADDRRHHEGLFSGTESGEERAALFTSAIPVQHAEDDEDGAAPATGSTATR